MNISTTINNITRTLMAYYIDNQLPFRVTILDRAKDIDLPASLFSQNGEVISIDIAGWCLETAGYDDKYLYVTYVLGTEEIPLVLPFVTIIGVIDITLSVLVLANPYSCDINSIEVANTNEALEIYIKNNKEGIFQSMSCLTLKEVQ